MPSASEEAVIACCSFCPPAQVDESLNGGSAGQASSAPRGRRSARHSDDAAVGVGALASDD